MTRFLESTWFPVLALFLLGTICVLALCHMFQPTMDAIDWQEEIYRVQEGDSLWAISGLYCPEGVDRREWIEEVKALNHRPDSLIHVGEKLIVLRPTED